MHSLVVLRDGKTFMRVKLEKEETTVGRNPDADIYLPDTRVSRTHFIIRREDEGFRLLDRSSNGTVVNGKKTRATRLHDQDTISVGGCQLRFISVPQELPVATQTADFDNSELSYDRTTGRLYSSRPVLLVQDDEKSPPRRYPLAGDTVEAGVGGTRAFRVRDGGTATYQLHSQDNGFLVRAEPGQPGSGPGREQPVSYGTTIRMGSTQVRLELEQAEERLQPSPQTHFEGMVGASEEMRKVFALLERYARNEAPVMILGETGTGKELVARALHARGPRAKGPFIAVNCSAISPQLFESELFGHEKGAFTGAVRARKGAFESAHGGTLFLDELGELPLELQPKLLRVLETRTVTPVGSHQARAVDVRVVAATHQNLEKRVADGRFRSDLFYRLFVLTLELPPLRRRLADLPLLVAHMLEQLCPPDERPTVSAEVLARLASHSWPGNVRELRHALTRATASCLTGAFSPEDFDFLKGKEGAPAEEAASILRLEALERDAITRALAVFGGNRKDAANALGIARSTLQLKLKKYGIDEDQEQES